MISFRGLESIYVPLKSQIDVNRLADDLPDMFVGTDPVGVFQYGHDVYEKRQHRKKEQQKQEQQPFPPQSTFASSATNPQLCQQNGCCPSCR